jgi:sporulation protein YlmC with PRC-barrel domain
VHDGLTKSSDVVGLHLTGRDGVRLGTVREIFVDLVSGLIEFLIVEPTGGLLGGSGKYHPIPWEAVRFDRIGRYFQAEISKDELKGAPSYDREQLANESYAWPELADRYFSVSGQAKPK